MFVANRSIFVILVPAISLMAFLYDCNAGQGSAPMASIAPQDHWQAHDGNPIFRTGDHIDRGLWNDPSVIKEGSEYVMYLTSSVDEPFRPPVLPFRAVSSDGVNWRLDPERPLLQADGTPYVSIETPSVVQHEGVYHMYFSGVHPEGNVPMMEIGHATSPDGINWTHDPDRDAVISSTGDVDDWNGFLVGEPGAVVFNDRIYLYFNSTGGRPSRRPPQLQVVGLATSTDGSQFDTPRPVLEQIDLYPPEDGFTGYSTPMAVVHQGRVHLFYDIAHYEEQREPQWLQVALHHAVSDDGETNFVSDDAPLLTRLSFEWTRGEILAPTVLFEGGTAKMWFAGHGVQQQFVPQLFGSNFKDGRQYFGIGYATADASVYAR